jgi:lysophospholipase L1-like esterase
VFGVGISKASAADYYINPGGTDVVTCGTIGSPCKSLEYTIENRLPGSGDTVILQAGAGPNYNVVLFKSGTDSAIIATGLNLTITAESTSYRQITIDAPSVAAHTMVLQLSGTVTWKGIRFTNSLNQSGLRMFWINYNEVQNQTFDDCYFSTGTAVEIYFFIGGTVASNTNLLFERCDFFTQTGPIISWRKSDASIGNISIKSSRFIGTGTASGAEFAASYTLTSFEAINSTFVFSYNDLFKFVGNVGFNNTTNLKFINNLFLSTYGPSSGVPIWVSTYPRIGTFNIHNNVFWSNYQTLDTSTSNIGNFAKSADNTLVQLEKRNWWLDPVQDENYNFGSNSKALGRGDAAELPTQDLNGVAWSGAHIGCYSNPSTAAWTMTPRSGKIVIIGDSIALGVGKTGQTTGTLSGLFGSTPFEIVGTYNDIGSNDHDQNMSEAGRGIKEVFGLIDRAAEQQQPQYVFFYYGHNNIGGTGNVNSPSAMTAESFANWTRVIMDKAADWGITPVWIGMAPARDGDHVTYPNTWNSAVETAITGAYTYDSMTRRFFVNSKYAKCEADGGYYQARECVAQCGSGADCLAQNVHPGTSGQNLALSTIYNLYFNKLTYIVDTDNQIISYKIFNGAPLIPAVSVMSGVTGTKIYNNTIHGIFKGIWLQANTEVKNTLFNSCTTDIYSDGGLSTTASNFTSTDGDPLFSSSDFHISSNSSAINAGTNLVWSGQNNITDFEGNPITNGTGTIVASGGIVDIGAYEFQDSTAPTTTANINTGLYNTTQNITLSCEDGAGVGCDQTYYTLDGTDPTTSSDQYVSPIEISTTTTLKYFSQDRNGNSETVKTKTYTIDTTPPNTTITAHPNSAINSTDATFTFEADETATFQCKLDSEAYAVCVSPKGYTGLAEGSHSFSVKAIDTATNEDPTPAEYTFTVDTQAPTLLDLSPNGTTFPVSTTSVNLTMSTSENAICRYATTSGTAYSAMTLFESTNSTTHSTLITGLNPGATYNYYVTCKDAINESIEVHLNFSIATAQATTITEKIKIKVERETNTFKDTIKIASTKFKLKSQDSNLVGGSVEIYKGNKLWKTISADASGAWSSTLKLGKNASEKIKVLFYDAFGTLIGNQSAKVKVDSEDPKFTKFITSFYATGKGSILYWEAKDNQDVDYYKVTFNKKTTKVKKARFTIPQTTPRGTYEIKVTAYDKVGNSATKKTWVRIR